MEPPRDEAELQARLRRLAGRSLGEIARAQDVPVPQDLRGNKGWVGQLLERALGATAGSGAEPDFPHLGIELKTIPINGLSKPMESCFVASLDLGAVDTRWETSPVRKKLARVAWVVVEADPALPLAARRFGASLLWSPSQTEHLALRNDYEDIVAMLSEGFTVRGDLGVVLQLRPKGRNAADLRHALDEEGAPSRAAPRAFYLRRGFTAALLDRHFSPRS